MRPDAAAGIWGQEGFGLVRLDLVPISRRDYSGRQGGGGSVSCLVVGMF